MSHSQFYSINLFTLRHAWLNLCDKHMTTGRINQVTNVIRRGFILQPPYALKEIREPQRETPP